MPFHLPATESQSSLLHLYVDEKTEKAIVLQLTSQEGTRALLSIRKGVGGCRYRPKQALGGLILCCGGKSGFPSFTVKAMLVAEK